MQVAQILIEKTNKKKSKKKNKKTEKLLDISPDEGIVATQLFGHDPEIIAQTASEFNGQRD